LLILGIGVGAIAGTIISVWNPGLRHADANDPNATSQANVANAQSLNKDGGTASPASLTTASLKTGRELTQLGSRIAPLTQGLTDLVPGVFLMEVDSGDFYSLNGTSTFSAASMIKIPILIAFFQDVDAGKIRLDEIMTLQQEDLADGSGDMQYSGVGTKYSALDTVTNMIIYSDNTATNMLIRRLGGIQVLNQRFQQWGLKQTAIRHLLPDLDGTNTTSPKELVTLLAMLGQGELISMKSRDRALDIMRHTVTDTLLPAAMGEGATIAHKTGDIGSLVGDSGIIDMPNGKRYIISAMVKRPNNDSRAQELIRHIARTVYDYLYDPNAVPSAASSPSPSLLAPTGNGAPAANPAGTAPPPANANAPSTTQTTDNPPPAVDRGNAAGAATDTGTAEPTASPEDNASTGSEPQATDNGSNGTGNETVDAAQSPEAEPSTSDEQDTANSNPSGSNTTPPAF
jgi:beta-lactamase class A